MTTVLHHGLFLDFQFITHCKVAILNYLEINYLFCMQINNVGFFLLASVNLAACYNNAISRAIRNYTPAEIQDVVSREMLFY